MKLLKILKLIKNKKTIVKIKIIDIINNVLIENIFRRK